MNDNRKRYDISCPECGYTMQACKSLAHQMGLAGAGHGSCLKCGCFMKLEYNETADTMSATKWIQEEQK